MGERSRPAISGETNVDALLSDWPALARVFLRRRMHCVGCDLARFETIAEVCASYGQPVESMLDELRTSARTLRTRSKAAQPRVGRTAP